MWRIRNILAYIAVCYLNHFFWDKSARRIDREIEKAHKVFPGFITKDIKRIIKENKNA